MRYFRGKSLIFALSIELISTNLAVSALNRQAASVASQQSYRRSEEPLIMKENTVAFVGLTQEDADLLVSENPKLKGIIADKISDFAAYANQIWKVLEKLGISVKGGAWKKIWAQYPDGKIEELIFNPQDIYGMAMFAKGKKPKLVAAFGAHIEPMTKILSEYFEMKIE